VLIHEVSAGAWGTSSSIEERLAYIKDVESKLLGEVASKSGQTLSFLKSIVKNTDIILDASEAIEFGIADGVLLSQDLAKGTNKFTAFASTTREDGADFNQLLGLVNKYAVEEDKGEDTMDLEQLMTMLKDEHSIDVAELQSQATQLADLSAKLVELSTAAAVAVAEKEAALAEVTSVKMSVLLDNLIAEGKATQKTNELNVIAFNAMGYDRAVEIAKGLPVIFNMTPQSASGSNEDDSVNNVITRKDKVKAYMKEQGMEDTPENYVVANEKLPR
jgi:hypothetical protein